MKNLVKQIAFWSCLLSGLCLVFIGIRFFLDPTSASIDYGVQPHISGDFSFQYIKGIRDLFFGLIIVVFLWEKLWQALGWVLLIGTIVPLADFCIVISRPDFKTGHTIAHLVAIVICAVCGVYYLKNKEKANQ